MIRYAIAAAALLMAPSLSGGEARAQADPYRWCADYAFSGLGGAKNCYFLTLEQCRATVSGVGGYCTPNPFYTGPSDERPQPPLQPARPRRQ
jgi:hypothetical protein